MKLIVNTITGWEEPPRARHQLTYALAKKGNEIIFVTKNKIGWPAIRTAAFSENIMVVTPFFPLDYKFRYRLPIINEIFQRWLYRKLFKIYKDMLVINFDFTAHRIFSYFSNVVYYCNDEYIGNSKYRLAMVSYYHQMCENRVIKNAKFCIATSGYLVDKIRKINSQVYYIPLGAPSPNYIPTDIVHDNSPSRSTIRPIHVGLVGFLSKRQISLEVINKILSSGMILSFVGPIEQDFLDAIKDKKNLVIRGILTGKELFETIITFDVGIAPYNLSRANKGTTPNKMWQYLSMGKPVVVSNLPNLEEMHIPEKVIYIAATEDDFIPQIILASQENTSQLEQKRIHFANLNTWDHRVDEFLLLMKKYFGNKS
jgi:hypothetical protein